MVFVDDATGKLLELQFHHRETVEAYMDGIGTICRRYGRPERMITDRFSCMKTKSNLPKLTSALRSLGIIHITSSTPQGKGRVERMNRTLQDRLIKWLERRGLDTVKSANEEMPDFISEFNRRFAKEPSSSTNAFRPVKKLELERALARSFERKLDRHGIFSLRGRKFQVDFGPGIYSQTPQKLTVLELRRGKIEVFYNGTFFPVSEIK